MSNHEEQPDGPGATALLGELAGRWSRLGAEKNETHKHCAVEGTEHLHLLPHGLFPSVVFV
jgi:hypothetical protein